MRLRLAALVRVVLFSAWTLTVVAAPARAATLMSAATLQAGPGGGAVLTLDFAQSPQFVLAGRGTPEVTITFLDVQALNLPAFQSVGPVRAVEIAPSGSNLVVRLHLTAPLRIGISRAGPRVIVVVPGGPSASTYQTAPQVVPAARAAAPGGRITEVVLLKYADVSEVVGVLVPGQQIAPNDSFVPTPSSLGTPNLNGGTLYGSLGATMPVGIGTAVPQPGIAYGGQAQSVGQRITDAIAIDRRLNAIVLTGTPAEVAELQAMIERLDIPLPSVLLETQIVELTETAARNVGIDFTSNGVLGTAQFESRSGGPPTASLNLQAAIFAQVANGGGRILARPQIVAQSGTSASILTGDALPIITAITFAGSSPVVQQQVQYISIGVNLQILPRITTDGFVTSHIYSEVSSVTGFVQSYPQISQRAATTSATVRDGESFVIGGLIQENELNSLTKVPGVGDLPLIGGLFRHRNDQRTRTNLYIVVTPRIVSSPRPAAPARP